jgi:hypothetical protein
MAKEKKGNGEGERPPETRPATEREDEITKKALEKKAEDEKNGGGKKSG